MQTDDQYCGRCGGILLENDGFPDCPACGSGTGSGGFGPEPSPSSPGSPLEVARIGEYEILEEIARGGMAIVFKAHQVSLNRMVALKVMLPGIIANRAQVQRFNAEAQIVAALNHPNIISVYEIGEENGTYYFSMPLVSGVDLSKKGRVDPDSAARYLEKIAQAVYHAHQRGVLHRDLKPSNVLIDQQDEPRVVDFGIAKLTAENQTLTQTGESLGTPSYMAPEQVHGDGRSISVAADVYALGGILYFLLTGRPPFAGASRDQILWAVFYDEPARPSQIDPVIPRDLETICLKCLSKEAEQRYATAGELAEDLGRYLKHEPISARPVSAARRIIMWARRNPALAVCVFALVAALSYGVIAQQLALRQARKARSDAEGLIEFMDKELTQKLRPLGRLDLTGDILARAEAYFRGQDEANSGPGFLIRKASFFWRAGAMQRDLGKLPEAEELARRGLATLDRFQAENPNDVEGWSLRGNLDLLIFRVTNDLQNREESRVHAQRALEDQRRALAIASGASKEITALAEVLIEVGRFRRDERDGQRADSLLNEATEKLTSLARQNPNDLQVQRLLAITHYHKGLVHQELRDNTAALAEFNLFIQALEAIAHAAADDRDWQYELAIAYGRAAEAQFNLGAFDSCEALVTKWRGVAEKLFAFAPNNVLWGASYAQSLAWSGLVIRDQAETDPRVPEFFKKAADVYQQLTLQAPNIDQYQDRIEEISANLARYYQKTNQTARAEGLLRSNIVRQVELTVRFGDRFSQQRRLAHSFENLSQFLQAQHRKEEGVKLCEVWIERLRSQFASPAPVQLWHWAEAALHDMLANFATSEKKYDVSVSHWRQCLDLLTGLGGSVSAAELPEEMAYAYKSLISVQNKRADLAGALSASSEAIDWLESSPPKSARVVADLCLFIPGKTLPLGDGSEAVKRLLSRCRDLLRPDSAALEKFDRAVKDATSKAS